MYYIGVDLGTSAVKLLLMDHKGVIKNIVSEEYPLFFPHPGADHTRPGHRRPEKGHPGVDRGI